MAALVIAAYLFRNGVPEDAEGRIELVVGLALAAIPPLVLGAFWLVVREVAELPARLRALPDTSREQAAELGRLADHARSGGSWLKFPRMLWRFGFLAASARENFTPWAPLLPLMSVPFLFATALAAVAALVELLVAAVLLIALAR